MAAGGAASDKPKLSIFLQGLVDGCGVGTAEIPFREICADGYCDIDSYQELELVTTAVWEGGKNRQVIFSHALLSDRGYPKRLTFPKYLGKKSRRFQTKIERPVEPGSTKTKKDNTPLSRLIRFCEKFVEVVINKDSEVEFELAEVNILESEPNAEGQVWHHDFEAYCEESLISQPNSSYVIPIGERGSMCVGPYTQDVVHAAHKATIRMQPPQTHWAFVRKELNKTGKNINLDDIRMKEIFFGVNEFLGFLDNALHGGAPNHMNKTVLRLHFYVVRKGTGAPSSFTFFPSELAWDIARNGIPQPPASVFISDLKKDPVLSKNFIFSDDGDIDEIDEDLVPEVDENGKPISSKAVSASKDKSKAKVAAAPESSKAVEKATKVARAASRAADDNEVASPSKKGRGRPAKNSLRKRA